MPTMTAEKYAEEVFPFNATIDIEGEEHYILFGYTRTDARWMDQIDEEHVYLVTNNGGIPGREFRVRPDFPVHVYEWEEDVSWRRLPGGYLAKQQLGNFGVELWIGLYPTSHPEQWGMDIHIALTVQSAIFSLDFSPFIDILTAFSEMAKLVLSKQPAPALMSSREWQAADPETLKQMIVVRGELVVTIDGVDDKGMFIVSDSTGRKMMSSGLNFIPLVPANRFMVVDVP